MIKRLLSVAVGAVLAASAVAAMAEGKVEVQWLGHSATKITSPGGKVIVIDPWLTTNPKTPEEYKKLEALGKVDMILVTHGHADHFTDAPALAKLNNVPVSGPSGLLQSAITLGILAPEQTVRFGKGGTVTPFAGIKVTATHAEHSSELVWRNPATGKDETHAGGEPEGFIIELENGFRIYHMGDTAAFGDMDIIGKRYKPDLILIPIGGHYTFGPADAAWATTEFLKPKYAIPIHYGTYPILKGTPEEYSKVLGDSHTKVSALKPGEKVSF